MSLDVYLVTSRGCVFDQNITHNLTSMADKAGIYNAVWRPDENGIVYAKELVPILKKGIADMKARPEYFKQSDASNGWGTYEQFLPWLEAYLSACQKHPRAKVRVDR